MIRARRFAFRACLPLSAAVSLMSMALVAGCSDGDTKLSTPETTYDYDFEEIDVDVFLDQTASLRHEASAHFYMTRGGRREITLDDRDTLTMHAGNASDAMTHVAGAYRAALDPDAGETITFTFEHRGEARTFTTSLQPLTIKLPLADAPYAIGSRLALELEGDSDDGHLSFRLDGTCVNTADTDFLYNPPTAHPRLNVYQVDLRGAKVAPPCDATINLKHEAHLAMTGLAGPGSSLLVTRTAAQRPIEVVH